MKTYRDKIKGERVTLKRLSPTKDYANMFLEVMPRNKEDILSWMAFKENQIIPKDQEDAKRIIRDINGWEKKGESIYYGIFLKSKFIGIVMADLYDDDHAETGSFLDIKARGFGYAREARLLLEREMFSNKIEKIIVSVDAENTPSINLLVGLGYKKEKFVKNNFFNEFRNQYRDEIIFSKLK